MIKNFLRRLLYPGLDLHTRNRASLRRFWRSGPRDVLDAGSGNGYFSWLAYRSGANVVALNVEPGQVRKAQDFLVGYMGADPGRLKFEHGNLYALPQETRRFDEIICYEVLEHVKRDKEVVEQFYRILRPGGTLHLCCPNKLHPRNQREVLDLNETGGHVRAGYTEAEYRALLEPAGFTIDRVVGLGPRPLYLADHAMRWVGSVFGEAAALPLLLPALPTVWLARLDPPMPFSLYVRAVKPKRDEPDA